MSRTNDLILNRVNELTIEKYSYGTPEYELYKKGFGVLTVDDTELSFPFNILALGISDFTVALLSYKLDKPFNEIYDDVSSFKTVLETTDIKSLKMIMYSFEKYKDFFDALDKKGVDFIPKYIVGGNLLQTGTENEGTSAKIMYRYYRDCSFDWLDSIITFKLILDIINNGLNLPEIGYQYIPEEDRKYVLARLNAFLENLGPDLINRYEKLHQVVDCMEHYFKGLERKNSRRIQLIINQRDNYDIYLDEFHGVFDKEDIIDMPTVKRALSLMPKTDTRIRVSFLKEVFKHNKPYYKRMQKKADSTSSFEHNVAVLLDSNGLSPASVNLSQMREKNYDRIKSLLLKLKGITLDESVFLYALHVCTAEHVAAIEAKIKAGILTEEALNAYPDLFVESSDAYKTLVGNIDILNKCRINPTNFADNSEVLVEHKDLKESIGILNEYGLSLSGRQADEVDYQFLLSPRLRELIDKLIEVGLNEYLDNDLNMLNESEERLDRLRVLNSSGLKPNSKEEALNIVSRRVFSVPDELLGEYFNAKHELYVSDNRPVSDEIGISSIPELRSYITHPRCIQIDGLYFSLPKVLRNYRKYPTVEESIFRALICDRILSDDEIIALKKKIMGDVKYYS